MKHLPFFVLSIFLFLAACSESTEAPETAITALEDETPKASLAPETVITELDGEKLKAALLTLNDLPGSWTARGPGFERYTTQKTYPFACKELEVRYTGEASDEFEMGLYGPFLGHNIYVFISESDAKNALADISDAISECGEWVDLLANHTVDPLTFPNLGDETVAAQFKGSFISRSNHVPGYLLGKVYISEAVYIREGNVIIYVGNVVILDDFDSGNVDSELLREMATLSLERLNKNK